MVYDKAARGCSSLQHHPGADNSTNSTTSTPGENGQMQHAHPPGYNVSVPGSDEQLLHHYGASARYSPPVVAAATAAGGGSSFAFTQDQVACVCEVCSWDCWGAKVRKNSRDSRFLACLYNLLTIYNWRNSWMSVFACLCEGFF